MENKINKLCSDAVSSGGLNSASCLVFRDGEELYSGFFGFADKENNIPIKRDSIFRLFSLTKPVTAAAAMILMDRGELSPEDPVSKYIPEYSRLSCLDSTGAVIPCGTELKLIHLLTMTSGIPYANNCNESVRGAAALFDKVISGQHDGTPVATADFARMAADIPLMFAPGTMWDYGISADVLGGIIEKVSDMSFGEFLEKNIFDPLEMSDTGFYVPAEKVSRFTALYKWQDGSLVRDNENYLGLTDYKAPPAFESGGAGLCSTIDDYSRFARMLCGKGSLGGVRIFSGEAFDFMTSPKLSPAQNTLWDRLKGYNYGCLVRVMTEPDIAEIKTSEGEFGWDGWTGTYFNANASTGITTLFFTQIAGAGTTWQAANISRIVYDELVRRVKDK